VSYVAQLSRRQRLWLAGTLAAVAVIVGLGFAVAARTGDAPVPEVTTAMTIRQIAPKIGTTGFGLARDFGLPRKVDKDTPLSELGVNQAELDEAAAHHWSHRGTSLKYFLYAAICLFGLVWLVRLGRPEGSPNSERKAWYPRAPYVAALLLAVSFCGFALGKSPNPMEGAVKLFKGMVGLQPSILVVVAAFIFFITLAIVGNKIVCGWACPFGASQELLYSLPILRRIKRNKVPLVLSNTIRGGLFVAMLLLLFGIVGGKKGFVIYHSMNPFNLFDLHFESLPILLTTFVALGLAVFIYRPFCQFICPFGFVSWLAERVSLFRVRVDHDRCNGCGACARACPLPAAADKVAGKTFGADCYSCARCLNVCPEEAIAYRSVFSRGAGEES
jgi:ferredoxin